MSLIIGRGGGVTMSGGGSGQAPALFQDDFDRADGPLGPLWQGSGAAISGNKVVITPTAGSEILTNGNMESGDPPSSWTAISNTLDGVADERTGGAGAQALDTLTSGAAFGRARQVITATVGTWYALAGYVKRIAGGSGRIAFVQSTGEIVIQQRTSSSASWTLLDVTARAPVTSMQVWLGNVTAASGEDHRFDDVSLKALTLSTLFATINNGLTHCDVSAKATLVAGTHAGVVANLDSVSSPANFVIAYHDGTSVYLDKCVGGTYTNLISAAVAYSAGAIIRIVRPAGTNTFQLWYNGVQRGADQSVSDAGIVSNTRHGLFSAYDGNSLDDYACGPT